MITPVTSRSGTRDQMVGTDSAEEEFDRYRPRIVDDYVGKVEDWGRAHSTPVSWVWGSRSVASSEASRTSTPGSPMRKRQRTYASHRALRRLAERSYGESNPAATMAGEVLTTAPTWFLPGGLLAQMGYGAVEAGLDHSSNSNAGLNALVGGVTTGIFGKAFDMVGRMFGNGAGAYASKTQ